VGRARPGRTADRGTNTWSALRARARAGGERGAALVEFALVLVLVAMLLFGIIEFGVTYNDYIAIRQGTREGTRLAVVGDVKNAPACKIGGTTITPPANPNNTFDATNAVICKTKDRIGLDQSKVRVKITLPQNPTVGSYVTICASYPLSSVTGLIAPFLNGRTLTSTVVMRLEQPAAFDNYSESGNAC